MNNKRPPRPGYRPRGVDPAGELAELALHKAVRAWLRQDYPDTPQPYGGAWLYAPDAFVCPKCSGLVLMVRIATLGMVPLYCVTCDKIIGDFATTDRLIGR